MDCLKSVRDDGATKQRCPWHLSPNNHQFPLRTHFLVGNVLDAAKTLKLAFRAKGERGAR